MPQPSRDGNNSTVVGPSLPFQYQLPRKEIVIVLSSDKEDNDTRY
jgi:hypothetical protein